MTLEIVLSTRTIEAVMVTAWDSTYSDENSRQFRGFLPKILELIRIFHEVHRRDLLWYLKIKYRAVLKVAINMLNRSSYPLSEARIDRGIVRIDDQHSYKKEFFKDEQIAVQ
jgi:hypothetical protein